MGNQNPRYKYDNILNLELEMPERTTQDYDPAAAASQRSHDSEDGASAESGSRAASTFSGEYAAASGAAPSDHLSNVYYSYGEPVKNKRPQSSKARPKTAGNKKKAINGMANSINIEKASKNNGDNQEQYPSARGIVKTDKRFFFHFFLKQTI